MVVAISVSFFFAGFLSNSLSLQEPHPNLDARSITVGTTPLPAVTHFSRHHHDSRIISLTNSPFTVFESLSCILPEALILTAWKYSPPCIPFIHSFIVSFSFRPSDEKTEVL
ncbi:hypothetical protein BO94DRAFT_276872 [Aspergillus sclerotioniger CBS 115572]|uniref:Secreted protein n=1 Tax=Aspergillus sclerotioniger CBS 115572 TaxID=1450535 RepID=A0A317XC10_9EURO|nr:hypothetical protein BO94DRAFT_276872 [Aspergillus sclerotioniger CBS 115572]PWY94498.1 hypothetical protein BO94DRAFT_276872 [Aspergillus sclerotioniger CBS 115572]